MSTGLIQVSRDRPISFSGISLILASRTYIWFKHSLPAQDHPPARSYQQHLGIGGAGDHAGNQNLIWASQLWLAKLQHFTSL